LRGFLVVKKKYKKEQRRTMKHLTLILIKVTTMAMSVYYVPPYNNEYDMYRIEIGIGGTYE